MLDAAGVLDMVGMALEADCETEIVLGPEPTPEPEPAVAIVVVLPVASEAEAAPPTTLTLPVVGLGIGWPSEPTSWPIPHCTPAEVVFVGGTVDPSAPAIYMSA